MKFQEWNLGAEFDDNNKQGSNILRIKAFAMECLRVLDQE